MQLPIFEFMRRFLQHTLPRGFHKVRYYGLLSPANKLLRQRMQLLLHKPGTDEDLQQVHAEPESDEPTTKIRSSSAIHYLLRIILLSSKLNLIKLSIKIALFPCPLLSRPVYLFKGSVYY